jgi:hypothetical protein
MDTHQGLGNDRPKKRGLGKTVIRVIFAASSVMQPMLCIPLVNSMVLNQEPRSKLVFSKIIITAFLTGLVGLAACSLHAQQLKLLKQDVDPAEARKRLMALITQLFFVAYPVCILVQWAASATSLPATAPFPAALFFAAYLFETRIDDPYVLAASQVTDTNIQISICGVSLIALYVLFVAYFSAVS